MTTFTITQPKRGRIICEAAYAQGKMLDNSSWNLPRKITPSDIDLVFDDNGEQLICELSTRVQWWRALNDGSRGQLFTYIAQARKGNLCALLHHSTPQRQQVDTRNGINSFSFLLADNRGELLTTAPRPGIEWPAVVEQGWYTRRAYLWEQVRTASVPLWTSGPTENNPHSSQLGFTFESNGQVLHHEPSELQRAKQTIEMLNPDDQRQLIVWILLQAERCNETATTIDSGGFSMQP